MGKRGLASGDGAMGSRRQPITHNRWSAAEEHPRPISGGLGNRYLITLRITYHEDE